MSIHVVWSFLMQVGINVFINCLFWSIMLRLIAPYWLTLQGWVGEYGMIPVIWAFTLVSVFAPAILAMIPQLQWLLVMMNGDHFPMSDAETHRLKRVWTIVCRAAGVDPEKFSLLTNGDLSLNACAVGSKYIVVNRGTLLRCHDDELAGIMAHELGHNQKKHTHFLMLSLGMKFASNLELWIFFLVIMIFGGLSFIPFIGIVFRIVMYILFVEYFALRFCLNFPIRYIEMWGSRREEYEADAFAVDAGFGLCLYRGLNRIAWESANDSGPRFTEDFTGALKHMLESTHPKTENRMKKILERLEKQHKNENLNPENPDSVGEQSEGTSDSNVGGFGMQEVLASCNAMSGSIKKESLMEKFIAWGQRNEANHCPECGAPIIHKVDKRGNEYLICENSRYWHLGDANCDFRKYPEKE